MSRALLLSHELATRDSDTHDAAVAASQFQGLGAGPRVSDAVARAHLRQGFVYYSRTAHARLGGQRERSGEWRGADSNLKAVQAGSSFLSDTVSYTHLTLPTICSV